MPPIRSKVLMTVALSGVCIWLVLLVSGAQIRYVKARRQLEAMKDRISGATRENDRLGHELELMRRPDWLALLARARLNYKRPDETVVFVYKAEKPGTISQPQEDSSGQPNWRLWLKWLSGQ